MAPLGVAREDESEVVVDDGAGCSGVVEDAASALRVDEKRVQGVVERLVAPGWV